MSTNIKFKLQIRLKITRYDVHQMIAFNDGRKTKITAPHLSVCAVLRHLANEPQFALAFENAALLSNLIRRALHNLSYYRKTYAPSI